MKNFETFPAETSRNICECGAKHSQFETSYGTFYYCVAFDQLISMFDNTTEKLDDLINALLSALMWLDSPPKPGSKESDNLKTAIGKSLTNWGEK